MEVSGPWALEQTGTWLLEYIRGTILQHVPLHLCARAPLQSPGHGEDDWRVCMAHGVIVKGGPLPCPVDLEGKFMPVITDFSGK